MSNITRIHPSPSKSKGHIFSIELKDKKIMFKAEDAKTKSIWICKLYEFAGHGMLVCVVQEREREGGGEKRVRKKRGVRGWNLNCRGFLL